MKCIKNNNFGNASEAQVKWAHVSDETILINAAIKIMSAKDNERFKDNWRGYYWSSKDVYELEIKFSHLI